jgi:hypothetical protein
LNGYMTIVVVVSISALRSLHFREHRRVITHLIKSTY